MTLPVDNPIQPGNIVENAIRTLSVDSIATGQALVLLCLPDGRHFSAEVDVSMVDVAFGMVLSAYTDDGVIPPVVVDAGKE